MFEFKRIDCPTCERDDTRTLGIRRRQTGEAVETTVVRCRGCGLIYPNPFPYPTVDLYTETDGYFPRSWEQAEADALKTVRGLGLRPGASLLDVGCGRGEVLAASAKLGIEAVGLEISPAMADLARKHGLVELATLEEFDAAPFDAVVLSAVIEHVHNPDSFVAAARRLIAPDGILYIDTPQEPHLVTMLGRLAGRTLNLSPTWPPYHVFGFNPQSLKALLGKHRFEINRLKIGMPHPAGPRFARAVQRAANATPWASNMFVWAGLDPVEL